MISFVRGTLSEIEENKVEIDTGSLGYEIFVPTSLIGLLPPIGEDVQLFTDLQVREDDISMYGFLTRDELSLFRQLITVSGIGPKGALGILSVLTPEDLRFAILSSDVKAISAAPGIGKKTAEKLIIELRDKVERTVDETFAGGKPTSLKIASESDLVTDTVMALTELGFSSKEAYQAVRNVEGEYDDAGELLHEALKNLGR